MGASAGGLAPTVSLLKKLGPTPNVAVVVVHHLDPHHESGLVEVLSRATELPVAAAQSGMLVEPNQVYVVPPNSGLLIIDGLLQLTPRSAGLHLPIDNFFESLAEDCATDAIGVLLAGTGQDGSAGVRAIKLCGGVTFAQDASAEHRGMPESAIATGCVDHVLPPAAIARELLRAGAHSKPRPAVPADEADFQRVLAALRASSTVDFANYKHSTLRRRVQRRVLQRRLSSLREYADLLEQSPDEAALLSEEALIHVTAFFRDPDVFEVLKTSVFPKLIKSPPRDTTVRVWVPGCSSGEELYSIAIALLEFLADSGAGDVPLKLFGTDVSSSAIDKARAGQYPDTIAREVSEGRLLRFFTKLDGTYRIRKDVRDLCVFATHDVTRDPPFARVDLISCRNLMIYLGAALQDRILPMFHYALNEPGFLVLGTSETVRSFPGFATIDPKSKVFKRTSAAPRVPFEFASPSRPEALPREPPFPEKPNGGRDVYREADRLVLAEFAPPGVVVTDDLAIVQFRGKTGPFLEPTPGVASFDLLRMVREDLRLLVRQTVDEARKKRAPARSATAPSASGAGAEPTEIEVLPFALASTQQRFFVVLFKPLPPANDVATPQKRAPASAAMEPSHELQLTQELASTRDYLQSVIEQLEASNEELKAANEEIVSSNEELRSTNEELQMAKEELEATNEELRTVNDEMLVRKVEGTRTSDDLTNLLTSADIPIIILGRDGCIRRYTPAASKWLELSSRDVGRSIGEIASMRDGLEILQILADVLQTLSPAERTMRDRNGRWYQLVIRPYLTSDNRVDGTVLCAFDIDAAKKSEQLLRDARSYAESIVDTVRECLLVVDRELHVLSANRAFLMAFAVSAQQIAGASLSDLDGGSFDLPALLASLTALEQGKTLEGVRVERAHTAGAPRVFELNARRVEDSASILLALKDLSELERSAAALYSTEAGYREMLTNAAEAIVMSDPAGTIVFANRLATQLFGYEADEMLGLPVERLVPERMRSQHASHRSAYLTDLTPRQMGRARELMAVRKDGSELPVEIVLGAMRREASLVIVTFINDVSERREAETRIRVYQDKLQTMAFDAAVAEERERRRIAIDLHDRIGQSLALAQIKLASVRAAAPEASGPAIGDAIELIAQSISDTRTLTFELSPPVLYDLGLKEAVLWLAEEIEKNHGVQIEVGDDTLDKPLDPIKAALVFRAVRELLMNVIKHAKTPTARVALRRIGDALEIDVDDKGVGFDPDEMGSSTSQRAGFGLFSVREQIRRLGGTVEVESAPTQGTLVKVRMPIDTLPLVGGPPEEKR